MSDKNRVRGKPKAATVISIIILIAGIAALGILLGVWLSTDGMTITRRVYYEGTELGGGAGELRLHSGENYFEIVSIDSVIGVPEYEVTITPNGKQSFYYTVDENPYSFARMGDVTEYFKTRKESNGFYIELPASYTAKNYFESVYPGRELSVPYEKMAEDAEYFVLTVSFDDGYKVSCAFGVQDFLRMILLDSSGIVF